MSLKLVELQVALPRTQDAGKLQEQMLKQNQHYQESLATTQLEQEKQKRKRVNENEELQQMKLKKEKGDNQYYKMEDSSNEKSTDEYINHPYLGNRVDFNG